MLHLLHHLIGSLSNDDGDGYENVTKWRWFPLLSRGLFVLWGDWGDRKRERTGHDGKRKERREAPAFSLFPSSPAHFLFFRLLLSFFIGILTGSFYGGERRWFKLYRAYSILFNSSNVGKFCRSWILKDCIKFKEKKNKVVLCSRPPRNVKLGIFT